MDPEYDDGADQAWDEELARREAEIRSGAAAGQPADKALAELRDRHSR